MKGEYSTAESTDAQVTTVLPGDGRQFLVVRFKTPAPKTLVLELVTSPDHWISRRDLDALVDPVGAVTGHLLAHRTLDPVEQMKRDLDRARRLNWSLQNEIMGLKAGAGAAARRKREGGKRGRRNP